MIPWLHRASGGFVQNHVPDSDLVPLRLVVAAGERAGFEVRDVESLREHYQKTLSFWLSNLERRFEDAERLVGRETARRFRLYLAASAVVFALGKIGVYQVLFAKRTARGEARRRRCRGVARRGTPTTGRDVPTRGASFVLDPSKPCELRDAVRQTPFDENGEAIARRARLSLSRRHADASTRWPLGRSRSIVSGRMKRMSFSIASRTALRNARADHAVGPRQDFSAAC